MKFMNILKLIILALIFCISANKAHADELQYINDGVVEFFCDAEKSYFYFEADTPKPKTGAKKQSVDVDSLLITSKEDSFGNIRRLGSKKEKRQCGVIKLVFESGYYNSNIQGMLGMLDYPLLSLYIDNKVLLNRKVLNLCESGGGRAECPTDDYSSIQSLEITKQSKSLYRIKLIEAYSREQSDGYVYKTKFFNFKVK